MKAFAVLAAIALLAATATAQTVNCTHTTVDVRTGTVIHFADLDKIKPDTGSDFNVPDNENPVFHYFFQICSNTAQVCGDEGDTPACQRTDNEFWSLGQLPTMTILDYPSSDKSRGVVIEYSNGTLCADGTPRRISITLECDPSLTTPLANIWASNHRGEDPCEYEIYAKSPYACPQAAVGICDGQYGCKPCASLSGCGWCAPLQRCLTGNDETPFAVRCHGARNWFVEAEQCVDCTTIKSCSACTAEADCHFCEESGCQPRGTTCTAVDCTCDTPCDVGEYCPPVGGACQKVPSTAGLIIAGMSIVIGVALIGGLGFYFYKKNRSSNYEGLN